MPESSWLRELFASTARKWAIMGAMIGVIAGLGATAFLYLIQFVSDYLLGGVTGFIPPNPLGEPAAPPSHHPDFLLVPLSTIIG
ncbi:MAG: hypothetical protein QXI37_01455, partial [Thermoprotei archaeon]